MDLHLHRISNTPAAIKVGRPLLSGRASCEHAHWQARANRLACPECRKPLQPASALNPKALHCRHCNLFYPINQGIPHLIRPSRRDEIARFNALYDAIRLKEGWANPLPGYYEALPFRDLSGKNVRLWQCRARSFQILQKWLQKRFGDRLVQILDAGAGSGWMSQRLGAHYSVIAIDINAGPHGLAAFPPQQRRFYALQGELNTLPLQPASVEVVIANASLHYTETPEDFLNEFHRVLRQNGYLIIMDSPVYSNATAVAEARQRTQAHYRRCGYPELAEYYAGLTHDLFTEYRGFHFRRMRPDISYRDWMAKALRDLFGRPTGARFPIWIGERRECP